MTVMVHSNSIVVLCQKIFFVDAHYILLEMKTFFFFFIISVNSLI